MVVVQEVHEVVQAIAPLTNGHRTPLLADTQTMHSASREARPAFETSAMPSHVALFVESSLGRMAANFDIRLSGPSVPVKLFTDLHIAQRWLLDDR